MSSIVKFMQDPLTIWFASCLDISLSGINYTEVIEGVLLHKIFLEINPHPFYNTITCSGGDPLIRIKNLELIVQNIQLYYEEKLRLVLLQKPDAKRLGQDPEMYTHEAKLLLLLLLGAAAQCPNKVKFFTIIQTLSNDVQASLMEHICEVTESQEIALHQKYVDTDRTGIISSILNKSEQTQNMLVEKQQELEENNEMIHEHEKDLECNKILLKRVDAQKQTLIVESRTAKACKDELDVAAERAERSDAQEEQLAAQMGASSKIEKTIEELQNYKDTLKDMIVKLSDAYNEYRFLRRENRRLRIRYKLRHFSK